MTSNLPNARVAELIALLGLQPHPEGGAYAEVHRSASSVAPSDGRGARPALTSIHFLLTANGASRWHRVTSDEVWVHLEGAPLRLYLLDETQHQLEQVVLGPVQQGRRPQHTVPAGRWQAATCEGDYSLVACIVAPGFQFDDFTLLDPDSELAAWWLDAHSALAHLL
jgi:predicted cupin superfamily sugar epimerase